MTDKELRRLRRDDLLQILINQQRQIDELNESLKKAQAAVEERRIAIEESGSVAEAALKLNGVFEAAQAAADQYAQQMREDTDAMRAQIEKDAADSKRTAEEVVRAARSEADRILREAERTKAEAERLMAEAGRSPAPVPEPQPETQQAEEAKPRRGLFGRNRKA